MPTDLRVNGRAHTLDVDPARPLLSVLRDEVGLHGARFGCGEGECGACTVLLGGERAHACVVKVGEVGDREVTTIEALTGGGARGRAVAAAFAEVGAMQCAFCTPGMVVAATALLASNPHPSESEIVGAMDANICRCGTYPRIVRAIQLASTMGGVGTSGPGEPFYAPDADVADVAGEGYVAHEVTVRSEEGQRTEVVRLPAGGLTAVLVEAEGAAGWPQRQSGGPTEGPESIGAWVHVADDGAVTAFTGKVEMGQGNRTSLAQMVAEEMGVPAERVSMRMGDTRFTPWDMGTFGSLSTPQAGQQLRKAAAAAQALVAEQATGVHFVRGAVALKPAAQWHVAGAEIPRTGALALAVGTHRYTSDLKLPGMLYGRVLRPPRSGAALSRVDISAASALPGVVVVHEGDFVGVAAPSTGLAVRALATVRADWTGGTHLSSDELLGHLRRTAEPRTRPGPAAWGGPLHTVEGDPDAALAAGERTLERTYTFRHIAHVPLETRAAVASWEIAEGGPALTVWTGTQRPFDVRDRLAEEFDLPEDRVRVIVPDTGSGYGGKHTPECALEAARLARAAGRPVRVAWTRDEEFRWAYYRPAGLIDVRSAFRPDGTITALEFENINSGPAGIRPVYAIPNLRLVFRPADSPFREGSYRALAATANHFARESHVEEIAAILGLDPIEVRLRNLEDPRARAVLEAAAGRMPSSPSIGGTGTAAGSSEEAATGARRASGIALGFEKGSYVATGVDIELPASWDGTTASPGHEGLRVTRIVTAFDCGPVVNPDNLRNQIEGALIMGLGGALFEAIDIQDGVVRNARLSEYRVPRFSDVPPIEIVLMDRKDARPVGAGETPIVAIAPAIGAAVARATGARPYGMPMAR